MAFIKQVPPDDASGPVKLVYDAAIARAGKIANIVQVMSLDGPSLAGSLQLYVSLMKSSNALGADRREMLAAVVSNVNDCFY